jgi:F0F1-type ATP synthase assembly protein I
MLSGFGFMENKPSFGRKSDSSSEDGGKSQLRSLGLFAVIVADLVGYTAAGMGLGYLACSKLGAPSGLIVVTSLAGLCLAFYQIYQITRKEL